MPLVAPCFLSLSLVTEQPEPLRASWPRPSGPASSTGDLGGSLAEQIHWKNGKKLEIAVTFEDYIKNNIIISKSISAIDQN